MSAGAGLQELRDRITLLRSQLGLGLQGAGPLLSRLGGLQGLQTISGESGEPSGQGQGENPPPATAPTNSVLRVGTPLLTVLSERVANVLQARPAQRVMESLAARAEASAQEIKVKETQTEKEKKPKRRFVQ